MIKRKTITIGAATAHPLTVHRLGYGTMRLTGDQIWGEPHNRPEALQILKAAVTGGINFLDTADYYGEDVTNRLIAEALYPYPNDLVICTKVGAIRRPDKGWYPYNKPAELRASIDNNLKTLKIDCIQLVHFRIMPDSETPLEESLAAMFSMQQEGKILHVGVSNVDPADLKTALNMGTIATVENAFGYGQRTTIRQYGRETRGMQEVLDICVANAIPMLPFFSLMNSLPKHNEKIAAIARKYDATPAQINIAWLLHYHDLLLPIPGTSQLQHFRENIRAIDISLTPEDMEFLG